ncbi:MAG: NADH-quinone oxidoreductase subunit H, partial [Dehalococcoidales bacterium]|nr:NADH-quinone oxidoreductase subunit H [Dehalococcoidales bacterium]
MNWNIILYTVLNTAFIFIFAPLLISLIKKVKAMCQGRVGPPLFQTYFQLLKLFKKEIVYSDNSSFIMRVSPYLNIAFLLAASIFIPVIFIPLPEAGFGNIIVFFYLMVCARFFMALAGLDAGSTFGGMGSSREMTISSIIEPVTLMACAALAFILKTTNIPEMFSQTLAGSILQYPSLLLVACSLFIILIIETARVPVDNPETHLELTMVHETMLLEQTGPKLALMELSYGINQLVLMALLINILFPWGLAADAGAPGILVSIASFIIKACILAVVIGIFESLFA